MFPPLVTIFNTNHCQHSCRHCFLSITRTLNTGEMDYQDFRRLIESLRGHGIFLISLTGGDPFLHPRAYDMIQAIGKADFKPLVACNLSPVIDFDRLLAMNVTSLQFSMDASNASGHDFVRGRGCFDSTCDFIIRAKRHGLKVNLSVCVTVKNRGDVATLVKLARHLGIYRLKFVFWDGFFGAPGATGFSLTKEMRAEVRATLVRLDRTEGIADWVVLSGFDLRRAQPLTARWLDLSIAANGDVFVGPRGLRLCNCFSDSDWMTQYARASTRNRMKLTRESEQRNLEGMDDDIAGSESD